MPSLRDRWIVSGDTACQLIDNGATLLDTRNPLAWITGHPPGAVRVRWQAFCQSRAPHKGKLLDDDELLQQKLRTIGIGNDNPVLVVGNPAQSFGEDGRIVWMLRTLGHSQTALVDGGYPALVAAGVPATVECVQPTPGDFTVRRTEAWTIRREALRAILSRQKTSTTEDRSTVLIDARQPKEYAGATPYGERRGGHLPAAVSCYYRRLLDTHGYARSRDAILETLGHPDLDPKTPIVAYCTGGVRSAFVVAVLVELGFANVKNYAGSMWEWAASPAIHYPLVNYHSSSLSDR
jgi:thiosulfate/3-mercaptopyruvate sulfurtransferase